MKKLERILFCGLMAVMTATIGWCGGEMAYRMRHERVKTAENHAALVALLNEGIAAEKKAAKKSRDTLNWVIDCNHDLERERQRLADELERLRKADRPKARCRECQGDECERLNRAEAEALKVRPRDHGGEP